MSEDRPRIVADHTEDSWRWWWHLGEMYFELEFVRGPALWRRRTKIRPGGWNDAQTLDLPEPETVDDAERTVRDYAETHPQLRGEP